MRKTSIGTAIALVASLALASSVLAAGDFTNGSFEDASTGSSAPASGFHTLVTGTASATAMDGWTVTAGSVDWVTNTYQTWQAEEGTLSIDMNGSSSPAGTVGTISQEFATTPNDTYTVEFWVSNNTGCGPETKSVTASAGEASVTVEVDSSYSVYQGQWFAAEPLSFVASSDSATLEFAADPSNTSNCGVALDNVTISHTAATGAECKRGGWHHMFEWADAPFMPFKNQGACVSSYAKAGMVPIGSPTADQTGDTGATSNPGAECKKGGWQGLTDASGASFKNQGACVSYYARGGQ